ncbi:hypothetical protein PR048_013960 [Dryococelus australis]|uniref:Uncharacterized protein n=1 Tax=Dryococelus australis TaxID=614101 RepID=A0ABQ9HTP6_9NEOP|nr:hypothetical protein PR048_013960 [Dryococelus australis]
MLCVVCEMGQKNDVEDSNQETVIELLLECDREVFPVINILIQVLANLPVSVVTVEKDLFNSEEDQNVVENNNE